MTGFARAEGAAGGASWIVEVKSVNGRALDLRTRQPSGFDAIEALARAEVNRLIRRGNVTLNLTVNRTATTAPLRLNRELLAQVLELAREIEGAGAAPPRLDALLSVRGVIDTGEETEQPEERAELEAAIGKTVTQAILALASARAAEGARLHAVLTGHLDEIASLTEAAASTAALQPATLRDKLKTQVQALLEAVPALPEERLAQEAALLIAKADVREELDRLRAHIAQARDMLAEGAAVGRRLDFLCQEFNREANTLCSKSADVELTRIGLSLKATIEQFREQVQNIE
ncbi:YicC/YloC family endoribonuclease [Nitrospirillum sp. BR 11163]|uniref:YicC/YloC family endoribonuclease n=1 Tax=Nitrospirillum sp. BR 11163 TaxID=3104323 RepID=UPI002AFDFF80|nr:YicC/YloC family endoribonuclease [Nitrospirillum sp. BR 11163]MEA1674935.1 YicC/YloC family endoribonuclease [Nitrospirillum sp. BR 11163]